MNKEPFGGLNEWLKNDWMNDWRNDMLNDRRHEEMTCWMNNWRNDVLNDGMIDEMTGWMNKKWLNECLPKWHFECRNDWRNDVLNEWKMTEWIIDKMTRWMMERLKEIRVEWWNDWRNDILNDVMIEGKSHRDFQNKWKKNKQRGVSDEPSQCYQPQAAYNHKAKELQHRILLLLLLLLLYSFFSPYSTSASSSFHGLRPFRLSSKTTISTPRRRSGTLAPTNQPTVVQHYPQQALLNEFFINENVSPKQHRVPAIRDSFHRGIRSKLRPKSTSDRIWLTVSYRLDLC